jgi:hypothetical protein
MPRVGFSIEEGVSSSQFKFEEGRGRIVAAVATVDKIGEYDAKCGIKVSVQRLGRDGKPTDDEPVDEFLPCGPITKFHPANAKSAEDQDPEDAGDEVGVEGNCILAIEGAHIDRKAKLWVFGSSAQEKGLRPALLDGYAPHLVDLDADFAQQVMPKGDGFTGKRDPTCLIVKKEGNIYNLAEINKRVGGGAGTGTGKPAPVPVTGKPSAPAAAKPTPAAASTNGDNSAETDMLAIQLFAALPGKKELTLTTAKVASRLMTVMVSHKPSLTPVQIRDVQKVTGQPGWIAEQAEASGWAVEGENVTIPVAG